MHERLCRARVLAATRSAQYRRMGDEVEAEREWANALALDARILQLERQPIADEPADPDEWDILKGHPEHG